MNGPTLQFYVDIFDTFDGPQRIELVLREEYTSHFYHMALQFAEEARQTSTF